MNPDYLLEMTVKELFATEPALVKMFMELKLNCIGCPMDEFHTLEDVAREYDLDLKNLLREIRNSLTQE